MIVKMKKLSIAGLMDERSAIVRRLMKLGVVQLEEIPLADGEREQALELAQFDDAAKRIAEIDDELRKIQSSIDFLVANAPKDKAKASKKELTFDNFVNPKTYKGVWEKVFEANDLKKRLNSKKGELNNLINERMSLSLWEKLDLPIEMSSTALTRILTGTVPASADFDKLAKTIDEIGCVITNVLNSDRDQTYVSFIIHQSVFDRVSEELKLSGFSKVNFGKMSGSVSENIARVDKLIDRAEKEIQEILKLSSEKFENLPAVQGLYDYIYNMQERRKVRGKFLKTDKAFIVGGWTPAEAAESVKKEIESEFSVCCVDIISPDEDEETPVLLKNNSIVYPFEMITEMYSLPTSKGIDPNTVMAPFYWLFFGIMLSDAGYGILLTVLSALAVWKLQTEKGTTMDKMLKMLALCGVSTTLWGIAFGGWFGDLSFQLYGKEVSALWFNPNTDPMRLMIWAFVFGAIHLLAGMAMNAYMLIREGKVRDAVFDIGFWYLVLIGIGMLFAGGAIANAGKYMLIAGVIGLILTQGRKEKNFVKKIVTGVMSLYNITGYLSDVLSYSRLLALGLATGVIAQVINQLGMLPGGFSNIFTMILLFIILIGGHIFNMAINTLGAYVHSSRLQYVEFFGKFYESGGAAFSPLKPKMKYLKIK